MKKMNKAYQRAVTRLDALVKETREAHHAAVDRFKAAAEEEAIWNHPIPDYDLRGRASQANAKAAFEECKTQTFSDVTQAWDRFDMEAKKIRADLANNLGEAAALRAGDVDEKAVALLNSGIMRSQDFAQMAQDFAENPAVLAILRATAEKYCDSLDESEGNAQEIYNTRRVIENVANDGKKELEAFDRLVIAANDLAGRGVFGFAHTAQIYEKTSLSEWEQFAGPFIHEAEEEG